MPGGGATTRSTDALESIGTVGVWSRRVGELPFARAAEFARDVEGLGYQTLWIPEGVDDKEVLSHAALLLAATETLVVATGIASVWARDPIAMANGAKALAEAFPGRFVLGIGISHPPEATARGKTYSRPLQTMRSYLDAMDRAPLRAVGPANPVPRVLAALAPGMLRLARARANGSHPYFVPVAHTALARRLLGTVPLLAPEQAVILESRAEVARRTARAHMAHYLTLDNYVRNLRRLGWDASDLADGGSDALVDALVAWGTPADVRARLRAHHKAGADHVCIQPLEADGAGTQIEQLRRLAPVLLAEPAD